MLTLTRRSCALDLQELIVLPFEQYLHRGRLRALHFFKHLIDVVPSRRLLATLAAAEVHTVADLHHQLTRSGHEILGLIFLNSSYVLGAEHTFLEARGGLGVGQLLTVFPQYLPCRRPDLWTASTTRH